MISLSLLTSKLVLWSTLQTDHHTSTTRGGAVAARVAHNHEVVGSSPAPATNKKDLSSDGSFLLAVGRIRNDDQPSFSWARSEVRAPRCCAQEFIPSTISAYCVAIVRPLLVSSKPTAHETAASGRLSGPHYHKKLLTVSRGFYFISEADKDLSDPHITILIPREIICTYFLDSHFLKFSFITFNKTGRARKVEVSR